MNESTERTIIAFTSHSLKKYGIRALRMSDIAQQLNVSKRTIYEVYTNKENLINTCLHTYEDRLANRFSLIRGECPSTVDYLWRIARSYIEHLFMAAGAFWKDVSDSGQYHFIYDGYRRIWSDELRRILRSCREQEYLLADVDVDCFVESFITLLYVSRVSECALEMMNSSAYYMIRGILADAGRACLDQAGYLKDGF